MAWSRCRRAGGLLACSLLLVGAAACAGDGVPDGGATSASSATASSTSPSSSSAVEEDGATDGDRVTLVVDTPVGQTVRSVVTTGPVTTEVVTRDGGEIRAEQDPWGRTVLRFPTFSTAAGPPRAVVLVRPEDEGEGPLSPGAATFTFGADFSLDAVSQGTAVDDGDNLMQRGLASDPSQFKIDVDAGRPSCRVQGPEGVAVVRLPDPVEPDTWYQVRCSRSETSVEIRLERRVGEGAVVPVASRSVEAVTGELDWRPGTPMSIGGKVAATGDVLRSSTDQFNGLVTDPVVHLGGVGTPET